MIRYWREFGSVNGFTLGFGVAPCSNHTMETNPDPEIEFARQMIERVAFIESRLEFMYVWTRVLEKVLLESSQHTPDSIQDMKMTAYASHMDSLKAINPSMAERLDIRPKLGPGAEERWYLFGSGE